MRLTKLIACGFLVLSACASYQSNKTMVLADGSRVDCSAVEMQTSMLNTMTVTACKAPEKVTVSVWPGTTTGQAALSVGTAVTGAASFALPFAYTANGGHL